MRVGELPVLLFKTTVVVLAIRATLQAAKQKVLAPTLQPNSTVVLMQ